MKCKRGIAPILASLMLVSISVIACILLSFWILTLSTGASVVAEASSQIPRTVILGAYFNVTSNTIDILSIDGGPAGKVLICSDLGGRVVFYESSQRGWKPIYLGGRMYLYRIPIGKRIRDGIYYCKFALADGELIIFRLVVYY